MGRGILKTLFWQHGSIGIAAVAVADGSGEWTAYIGAVYDAPVRSTVELAVEANGTKLREAEAYGLFPSLMNEDLTYRA